MTVVGLAVVLVACPGTSDPDIEEQAARDEFAGEDVDGSGAADTTIDDGTDASAASGATVAGGIFSMAVEADGTVTIDGDFLNDSVTAPTEVGQLVMPAGTTLFAEVAAGPGGAAVDGLTVTSPDGEVHAGEPGEAGGFELVFSTPGEGEGSVEIVTAEGTVVIPTLFVGFDPMVSLFADAPGDADFRDGLLVVLDADCDDPSPESCSAVP